MRDVERRIQMAEAQSGREMPVVDQPAGIPNDFAAHAKLMFDLLALAYQTDLTRVATFMIGREVSSRPYPEIGISDSHHPLSHHENDPVKIDDLGQVNRYHMEQFAHLVDRLAATPDGDASLLDQSLLVYGAGISDSNTHFHDNLPIALIGGRAAGLRGGRHVRYPDETPVTNLWMTLLDQDGRAGRAARRQHGPGEAALVALFRRGCAPNPRRSLAGTPSPRAATAEARCARHPSDGASPRTPGVRLRGPLRPAPLPPRRAVRGIHQTGLRPEPPAFACGDPTAPRRCRRGALCAASIRRGCAPNPRRSLAGTPLPRAAAAEARCARLAASAGGVVVRCGCLAAGIICGASQSGVPVLREV